jgi:hypothetical protein
LRGYLHDFPRVRIDDQLPGLNNHELSVGGAQVPLDPHRLKLRVGSVELYHEVVDLGQRDACVEVGVGDVPLALSDHPVRVLGVTEDGRVLEDRECERVGEVAKLAGRNRLAT